MQVLFRPAMSHRAKNLPAFGSKLADRAEALNHRKAAIEQWAAGWYEKGHSQLGEQEIVQALVSYDTQQGLNKVVFHDDEGAYTVTDILEGLFEDRFDITTAADRESGEDFKRFDFDKAVSELRVGDHYSEIYHQIGILKHWIPIKIDKEDKDNAHVLVPSPTLNVLKSYLETFGVDAKAAERARQFHSALMKIPRP